MTVPTLDSDLAHLHFPRRLTSPKVATATSLLGGGALVAYGISRKNRAGAALAGGGIFLIYNCMRNVLKPYSGRVRVSYTIAKPLEEVYSFVRNPANWDGFVQGLQMETQGHDSFKLTFWNASGFSVTSEAKITEEAPGQFIAWSSDAGSVRHRGTVRFRAAAGERGTEISVAMEFHAPAGPIARTVAGFVGRDPQQLVRENMRYLKRLLEAGEIPNVSGQPVGARGMKGAALRVLYREAVREDDDTRLAGD